MMLSIGLVDRICIGIIWIHPLFARTKTFANKKRNYDNSFITPRRIDLFLAVF